MSGLINIRAGSNASSTVLNQNFQYLDNKYEEPFQELKSYVDESLAAIRTDMQSQYDTLITQLNSQISALTTQVNSLTQQVQGTSSIIYKLIPDYSTGTKITSGWKATSIGWVNWDGSQAGDKTTKYLKINGVEVGKHAYYKYGDNYRCQFLVNKGDTIKFDSGTSAKFFRCKG